MTNDDSYWSETTLLGLKNGVEQVTGAEAAGDGSQIRAGGSALAVEAVAGGTERGGEAAFAVGEVAAGHVGVDQLGGFLEFPKLAGAFWCRRLGRLVSERGVADEFLKRGALAGRRVGQGVLLEVF